MADKITFGDLRSLLEKCGFDRTPAAGPYVVYRHRAAGAVQAFRRHRASELADPMTLASVRKTLVGFGLMEEEGFEAAIRETAAGRKAKARRD